MIDLETWGTGPNALITSIGAARFDPNGSGIIDSLELPINPVDAQRYGFDIDADTVLWWMQPDRDAARGQFQRAGLDLGSALDGFAMWFNEAPGPVWGNGAAFDNVLLRNAYQKAGLECPWPFWNDRCYRTMKSLTSAPPMGERTGTHHEAVDDAVSQALHLQQIVKQLEIIV